VQTDELRLYSERVLWPDFSLRPTLIELSGASIAQVAELPRSELGKLSSPGTLRDLGNAVVTPAFVNAHTHLAMCALRGLGRRTRAKEDVIGETFFRIESALEPGDVRAFSRLGAYECLLSGTGLVWDHYYYGREVAAALLDTGLAGVVASTLQDLAGPGAPRMQTELESTLELHHDASLSRAGIFSALGPHAPDTVSERLWRTVREHAREHELPVHFHVAQSYAEVVALDARERKTPLTWLLDQGFLDVPQALLVHAMFASAAELQRLDAKRHVLGFCPFSELAYCFPPRMGAWESCGLSYFLATDSAACNDSMSLPKEMRVIANEPALETSFSEKYAQFLNGDGSDGLAKASAVEEALGAALEWTAPRRSPQSLLGRVWSIPGALHPKVRAGVIAPGALANLAIWDTTHPAFWPGDDVLGALVHADVTGALQGMIVAGRVVGEIGNFSASVLASDAYRGALTEASERRKRLFERAGVPAVR
jgi:5-methylthioadenosine/S-adenosylhomocysteine deaminase